MADTAAHVVTLGTAGGPRWWPAPEDGPIRHGISTAVVIGEHVHMVDCGYGTGAQLAAAGIRLGRVRSISLTHLHSDHVVDLAALLLFSQFERRAAGRAPIAVRGPGRRGGLPELSAHATGRPHVTEPDAPTPGTQDMVSLLCAAHATDLNDRAFDSLTDPVPAQFRVADIALPEGIGFHPDDAASPPMEPFEIFRDDEVTVSATLVAHPPTSPAFAFRFDTAHGSVTISGDTAPCDNLVRLAQGTDLLLHEAIDLELIERRYAQRGATGSLVAATMDHHRRAHTTPEQAGEIATRAGVGTLALHHLVPGDAPRSSFDAARGSFAGPVLVPADLDVIDVGGRSR